MPQTSTPIPYRIFLLSVWCDSREIAHGQQALRFRLENPRTGVQHGFGSAEELISFLQASLTETPGSS